MKCWLFKSEKLKGKSTNLGHHSTPFLSPSLAFGFRFLFRSLLLFGTLIHFFILCQLSEMSVESFKMKLKHHENHPNLVTKRRKKNVEPKKTNIYDKENERKKMRTKESHRLLFIAFFWLLSSMLRFFYDDSDDMRMDFVCFMDSLELVWNWALLTFWNKARHINMCCHLLNLKLLSRNFNTN